MFLSQHFHSEVASRLFQKYKKPKFIQCLTFSLTGDVLTGDSEGNILTWGKSAADVKTLGKGAKGQSKVGSLCSAGCVALSRLTAVVGQRH